MNYKFINISNLFILALLLSNCVQEFDPPSQGYENLLVVDAFLSNGKGPFEVKLSRSTPIDTSAFIPESGASISLSDESEKYFLVELDVPGLYVYPGNINAQTGKSYQIHIKTNAGSQYESSIVTMRETPAIDSVTFRYEERSSTGINGVQIYVTTHDPDNNTWYYRWDWEETWKFRTPYNSNIYWDEGMIKPRDEQINTCWKNGKSTSIKFFNSKNLIKDIVADYPLLYVDTNTDRLISKYSINVKQYSLSEESFNYWKELQKTTENLGTLFDPQPTIIKGNIFNIEDEDEIVLGYFDASTVQEKRIFIRRSDLPPTRFPNNYSFCEDSLVSPNRVEEMVEQGWWLVESQSIPPPPVIRFSSRFCIDCTLDGTNVEPDFWE